MTPNGVDFSFFLSQIYLCKVLLLLVAESVHTILMPALTLRQRSRNRNVYTALIQTLLGCISDLALSGHCH